MSRKLVVMLGTQKGVFCFHGNDSRDQWTMTGPHLGGWEISALHGEGGGSRRIYAGTSHYAYGATVRYSDDLGAGEWTQLPGRPEYPAETGWKLNRIWQITGSADRLLAGVDEAGLFQSTDRGQSWSEFTGLTRTPTRSKWFPGAGGLCLHTILVDPTNAARMWVGISAVGAFRTDDGGKNWKNLNATLPTMPTGGDEQSVCCCVHKIAMHPTNPSALFMQYHGGVLRSTDAGDHWERIETGLPGNFGFPMVITPAGELFIAPLASDENRVFRDGKCAIYRSTDNGANWTASTDGLPSQPYFAGVLRDAMAVDPFSPGGVYFGTTMGDAFHTSDGGKTWKQFPGRFPRITTVRTVVVED